MARALLIVALVAVAFWVYTIVDCAVQHPTRHRGVSKPVWILIVVVLPVLGGVLWLTIGRGSNKAQKISAPDDDPTFLAGLGTIADQDEVKGTGRAAECALEMLPGDLSGTVLVTYGDVPLLAPQTLAELLVDHHAHERAVTILTAQVDDMANVVVVGDTSSDIDTARRARAGQAVGVLTGAHDEHTLRAAGADRVLASVADLPALITAP